MKIYIFMICIIGVGHSIMVHASDGPSEHPQQMSSPYLKGLLSFMSKRSSSHSSSVTISSDHQSDGVVGSFDSASSMHSASSSYSSSSASSSIASPQLSGRKTALMIILSRAKNRFLRKRTSNGIVAEGNRARNTSVVINKEDPTERATFLFDAMDNEDVFEKTGWVLKCIGEGVPAIFTEEASYIDMQGMDEADSFIATLEDISDKLQTYQKRADVDFVSSYTHSLKENFKRVKLPQREEEFDPNSIYDFLEIKNPASTSNEEVRKRIKEKEASNPGNDLFFRQLEWPFRNNFCKQDYDAYLVGPDALKKLMIDEADQIPLMFLTNFAIVCKNNLREYQRTKKLRSASQHKESQSQHNASPDLANHALKLELDIV